MARPQKLPGGLYQRGKTYCADFRAGGRRVRKKLSRNLEAATKMLNDLRRRTDLADFGILDNDYPVADLKDAYLRHLKQVCRPGTVVSHARCLKIILPELGAIKVSHIHLDGVQQVREARLRSGIRPSTVNRDTTILNAMLNWGVKYAKVIATNPMKGLKRLANDDPKVKRPFTNDEVRRLLEASQEPWRSIWYTLLTTGVRFGELAALRFEDLDWGNREIVIPPHVAKNHKERRVPMDNQLHEILSCQLTERASRQPGRGNGPHLDRRVKAKFTRDHVLVTTQNTPLNGTSVRKRLLTCCKKAGIAVRTFSPDGKEIEHVDIHTFRVTFASDLLGRGVDPNTVRELLGHSTLTMTMKIYGKVSRQGRRQGIAKLSYGAGAAVPEHILEMPPAVG